MKFKFKCGLCKKDVKRGDKFRVEIDMYESDMDLSGHEDEEEICKSCADKIQRKIISMRREEPHA